MLSISSNIDSLIAQENLNGSGSALTQAVTRLSSGKRLNSAADDAADLAIATTLQSSINGLNQGVSNANDGVSLLQTASEGVTQITQSLQTIRQLAVEAAGGTLSVSDKAALQQDVAQQIAEVNRIASQTSYNGLNLLNGTAGVITVQVGAEVGQTVSINLGQGLSAALLGAVSGPDDYLPGGTPLGTLAGLDLTSSGAENTSGGAGAITAINVVANGLGGFRFTDQNGQTISSTVTSALFTTTSGSAGQQLSLNTGGNSALLPSTELAAISAAAGASNTSTANAAAGTVLGVISGVDIDPQTGAAATSSTANAITSISVQANGAGSVTFVDQNGNQLSSTAASALFDVAGNGTSLAVSWNTAGGPASTFGASVAIQPAGTALASINANNGLVVTNSTGNATSVPTSVAALDVTTMAGANLAMETIDDALASVSAIQATLGAAQNRFVGIAGSQQAESTDLSSAQSQITDADFAQETANLSQAEVLNQAGISVLAQANSQAQQVMKLLQ
jgi:flagellin